MGIKFCRDLISRIPDPTFCVSQRFNFTDGQTNRFHEDLISQMARNLRYVGIIADGPNLIDKGLDFSIRKSDNNQMSNISLNI